MKTLRTIAAIIVAAVMVLGPTVAFAAGVYGCSHLHRCGYDPRLRNGVSCAFNGLH